MDEALVFLHLSDIHFNKKWHDHYELDQDLRDQIENDVRSVRDQFTRVQGVLVSGDVAFSGRKEEYSIALEWLKRLCDLAGCREQDVWCVPGNHDVDRSVYDSSPLLRNMHDALRPNDRDAIDDRIAEYLRDEMAALLLFRPIERYNDFAAKFRCPSRPDPLAWQHDLRLNDSSLLRIHGINSALTSDRTDDDAQRRLVVGTRQVRPREEAGVVYLAMCHHPPDWLLDQDRVSQSLNARARIQLFGHKHFQTIDEINNCLRIGSGAVHPSRKEKNWLPRYNWLALSVRTRKGERLLQVDVHPRVWSELRTRFVADYDICNGQEHRVYTLKLEQWTPPAPSPVADPPVSDPVPAPSPDAGPSTGATMVEVDPTDAARTLTYRFLDLPHVVRLQIAQSLGLYRNEDEGLLDSVLFDRIFERATSDARLEQLWQKVEERHGDGQNPVNPYVGR
jgi:hypothetical protein